MIGGIIGIVLGALVMASLFPELQSALVTLNTTNASLASVATVIIPIIVMAGFIAGAIALAGKIGGKSR